MSSPVSKGILCRAYIGYLRMIYKKETVNYQFEDLWYKYLRKLGLKREDMLILMPYAMIVDSNLG